jgi:hypothetical protein
MKLEPRYLVMVTPSRWFAGGRGLNEFRDQMLNDTHISELHDFLKPELIFQNINLRGGICYFLWDKAYDNTKELTKVFTYKDDLLPKMNSRSLKTEDSDILIRHSIAIDMINKISSHSEFESFENHISSLRPFGFRGYFSKDEKFRETNKGLKDPVICYGKGKKIGYIERDEITKNTEWIDKFKVYTPRANNIGTELNDDNLNTFVGSPKTICTESYIVVGVDLKLNKNSATNLCKYFTTKFARFQHSVGKASQDATSKTYNTAGMGGAVAIIPNVEIREKFLKHSQGIFPMLSRNSIEIMQTSLTMNHVWLDSLLVYLRSNHDLLFSFANKMSGLKMLPLEATYLAWIQYDSIILGDFQKRLFENGLHVLRGDQFLGKNFIRVNIACTKKSLKKAIMIMKKTIDETH